MEVVNWGTFATYFDLTAQNNPAYHEILGDFLGQVARWKLPSGDLLDLGAGTGNFSVPLASLFPERRVIHLDASEAMNDFARDKAQAARVTNLHVLRSDAHEAEIAPESIAGVVCIHALYAMPRPEDAIARLYTWLKPGGYAFVCDLGRQHDSFSWGWYFFRTCVRNHGLRRALRLMRELHGLERQTARITSAQRSGAYWTHTLEQFAACFERRGFHVLSRRVAYRGYSNVVVCQRPMQPAGC